MKQPEKQKASNRCNERIEHPHNNANTCADYYNGYPTYRICQFSTERAGNKCCDREQPDDQSLILFTSQGGEIGGQFRDDHVEAGKEQVTAQTQQPEFKIVPEVAHWFGFRAKNAKSSRYLKGAKTFNEADCIS